MSKFFHRELKVFSNFQILKEFGYFRVFHNLKLTYLLLFKKIEKINNKKRGEK